jgi:hypothetical protein
VDLRLSYKISIGINNLTLNLTGVNQSRSA